MHVFKYLAAQLIESFRYKSRSISVYCTKLHSLVNHYFWLRNVTSPLGCYGDHNDTNPLPSLREQSVNLQGRNVFIHRIQNPQSEGDINMLWRNTNHRLDNNNRAAITFS